MLFHATCVAIDGRGVLIAGPSGCGKSDLALRLIDGGALLVADDQVDLLATGGQLEASCPPQISGKIEVRGVGVLEAPATTAPVPVVLLLEPMDKLERLPEQQERLLLGVRLPVLELPYFEVSIAAKIRLFLRQGDFLP